MSKPTYIDSVRNRYEILVAYRTGNIRSIRRHKIEHRLYYDDADSDSGLVSISGSPVSEYRTNSMATFNQIKEELIQEGVGVWESDVGHVYRILGEEYSDKPCDLHTSIYDIELDSDPSDGFPYPDYPKYPVNAISTHNKWNNNINTIFISPDNMTDDEAISLLEGKTSQDEDGNIVNTAPIDDFGVMNESNGYKLMKTEKDLLLYQLKLWDDADVLSAWNGKFFDGPYIVNRMLHIFGDIGLDHIKNTFNDSEKKIEDFFSDNMESNLCHRLLTKLSSLHMLPIKRKVKRYGNIEHVYDFQGTIDLDYLELYRKYTLEEKHSYKLDSILEEEINEKKVEYKGSLYDLYRKDFRKFIAYSRQDTMGLSRLDDSKKFIDLANNMIHMAGVRFKDALGSVVLIEQAMMKEYHKRNIVMMDQHSYTGDTFPIPGAFVIDPRSGLVEEGGIMCYDYNSLYPSIIRTLNLSPETIIGTIDISETLRDIDDMILTEKIKPTQAWYKFAGTKEYQEIILRSEEKLKLCMNDTDEVVIMTAREISDLMDELELSITPFGLLIDNSSSGVIPDTLALWYNKRTDAKSKIKELKNSLMSASDKIAIETEIQQQDTLQQTLKLLLNSTYGAMANEYFRMYDPRMAASITLGGRMALLSMIYALDDLLEHEGKDLPIF